MERVLEQYKSLIIAIIGVAYVIGAPYIAAGEDVFTTDVLWFLGVLAVAGSAKDVLIPLAHRYDFRAIVDELMSNKNKYKPFFKALAGALDDSLEVEVARVSAEAVDFDPDITQRFKDLPAA